MSLYRIGCIIFILMHLGWSPLFGQTKPELAVPTITDSDQKYRAEEMGGRYGLNSVDISELFQDIDGFIWVGTKGGISRFDGYEFINYSLKDGFSFGQINAIEQDSSGTMWVGGMGGLFWKDEDGFHKTDLGDFHIRDLHIDQNQNLWVVGFGFVPFYLTFENRYNIQQGQHVNIVPIVNAEEWKQQIGALHTWAIDTDRNGIAWLGMDDRHAYFDGSNLHVTWKDTTDLYEFSAIAAINQDSVFWGSEEIGLLFQRNNKLEIRTEEATYMMVTTDSSLYFFTTQELLKLKDGQWTRLYSLYDYDFDYIYPKEMLRDREGNFWIGGVGNLIKLSPARMESWAYPKYQELFSNHGITGLSNGDIIIGSFGGQVIKKTSDNFELVNRFDVPKYSYVGDVYVDQRGWVWYVTSASGIVLNQGGDITYFSVENGLTDNSQLFIYCNSDGEIWTGGELGITYISVEEDSKIKFHNYMADLKGEIIPMFRDLFEGPGGSVWAVSDQGLYILKDEKLELHRLAVPGSDFPAISGAEVDQVGRLWLTSQGKGLLQCQFNNEGLPHLVRQWTTEDGMLSDLLLDVHVDQRGRVWTASQSGVSYLTEIDSIWDIHTIDRRDGWPDLTTSHSEMYEDGNGKLWIMNFTSLVAIPLYDLPVNNTPPQSFVSKVELMDDRENIFYYADNERAIGILPVNLELPYDKNFIRFSFTSTSYTRPEKNRYFYRLIGLDQEWTEATGSRSVPYPGLHPGSFKFEVKAVNNDGVLSKSIATFSFLIEPPWYNTWWAYAMMLLVLTIGLMYLYRFQLSRKMAYQEAVRLKELDDFKTRFYDNITHEFRTPLTVIGGMAEDLKHHVVNDSREKLNLIQRNTTKLLDLVNQMLDLSRIQTGDMKPDYQQEDIIHLLRYMVASYSSVAMQKNIEMEFHSDEDCFMMDVDSQKLEMVLTNLISNSIKFTPEYGSIQVVSMRNGKEFKIDVKDTGIGIPSDQLKYIFDRFHQTDPIHGEKGSGIGLALVKELLQVMNGRIEVMSQEGQWSTFSVYLPIHFEGTLRQVNEVPTISNVNSNLLKVNSEEALGKDKPLLLLVEDNKDVAYYIELCLSDAYQFIHRLDGLQGWESTKELIPDIVISDVMMPEMDGFELCEKIKIDERTNHIPVILLTAKASTEDRISGLQYGADAYLTKPFEKQELMVRLAKLLEIRSTLQHKYSASMFDSNATYEKDKHPFLLKAERIVIKRMDDENLSVDLLASHLHLSTSQTYRKIKALTDMSTAIFIRTIRLEQAKELLKDESQNISEIAYQTGFKTPVYFSQSFKETYGMSPSEYRANI